MNMLLLYQLSLCTHLNTMQMSTGAKEQQTVKRAANTYRKKKKNSLKA